MNHKSRLAPTRPNDASDHVHRDGIGLRIKSSRHDKGFSQRLLAQKLGVSAGAVGQWESGGKIPATERLAGVANALNVSVDWLLGKAEQAHDTSSPAADIDEDIRLIHQARELGVDLHKVLAEARQRKWLEENRGALADANVFLERYGLWSDGKRLF